MSYFEDLTPYSYLDEPSEKVLNVGWLNKEHPFELGLVPHHLVERLRMLAARHSVNQTRGFHECEFCTSDSDVATPTACSGDSRRQLGSAEIRVASRSGVRYASPDLVVHYVECHAYLPPKQFLDALAELQL